MPQESATLYSYEAPMQTRRRLAHITIESLEGATWEGSFRLFVSCRTECEGYLVVTVGSWEERIPLDEGVQTQVVTIPGSAPEGRESVRVRFLIAKSNLLRPWATDARMKWVSDETWELQAVAPIDDDRVEERLHRSTTAGIAPETEPGLMPKRRQPPPVETLLAEWRTRAADERQESEKPSPFAAFMPPAKGDGAATIAETVSDEGPAPEEEMITEEPVAPDEEMITEEPVAPDEELAPKEKLALEDERATGVEQPPEAESGDSADSEEHARLEPQPLFAAGLFAAEPEPESAEEHTPLFRTGEADTNVSPADLGEEPLEALELEEEAHTAEARQPEPELLDPEIEPAQVDSAIDSEQIDLAPETIAEEPEPTPEEELIESAEAEIEPVFDDSPEPAQAPEAERKPLFGAGPFVMEGESSPFELLKELEPLAEDHQEPATPVGSSLGASTDPGEEPVEPPEIRDEVCQPEELGAEFGLPQPEAEAEPIAVDTEQEVDAATGEQTIDEPEEGHELLARLSELKASIETAEAEMDRVEQLLRSEIGGLREKLRALGDELGSM